MCWTILRVLVVQSRYRASPFCTSRGPGFRRRWRSTHLTRALYRRRHLADEDVVQRECRIEATTAAESAVIVFCVRVLHLISSSASPYRVGTVVQAVARAENRGRVGRGAGPADRHRDYSDPFPLHFPQTVSASDHGLHKLECVPRDADPGWHHACFCQPRK